MVSSLNMMQGVAFRDLEKHIACASRPGVVVTLHLDAPAAPQVQVRPGDLSRRMSGLGRGMAPQGEPAILKQVLYDRDGMMSLLTGTLIRTEPCPPVDRAPLKPSNTGDQIPRHRISLRRDTRDPRLRG